MGDLEDLEDLGVDLRRVIKPRLQCQQKLRPQLAKFGLGIHQRQNHFAAGQAVEIDQPSAAAFAHTLARSVHLSQRSGARN